MRVSQSVGCVNKADATVVVGRNSHFHDLTQEEHDELGGVEYRALRILFWIVLLVSPRVTPVPHVPPNSPQYYICFQLFAFIIAGPYIAAKNYQDVFRAQYRYVPEYWFSAFQVVSAFSNTGMSLCDQSMVPFQSAYVLIASTSVVGFARRRLTVWVVVFILIFAGNTAFPIL